MRIQRSPTEQGIDGRGNAVADLLVGILQAVDRILPLFHQILDRLGKVGLIGLPRLI